MAGCTTFDDLWREGVDRVTAVYRGLPKPVLERLGELAAELVSRKSAMQAMVETVDAASHCAGCGGECCVAGKFHFTRADMLVFLVTGEPLFTPLFDNGLCPYLAPNGCLISAPYRPFNCITFNCELIEDSLTDAEVARFYRMERELREIYSQIRSLFPDRSMDGALLSELPKQ